MFTDFTNKLVRPKISEKRTCPKMDMYLDVTFTRAELIFERLRSSSGYPSGGSELLRHLLASIDIAHITKLKGIHRVLYIKEHIDELFQIISPEIRPFYKDKFVYNKDVREIIVPVHTTDPVKQLPVLSTTWEDWKSVRALRVVDHDSIEFTMNLEKSALYFTQDTPSYVVFTLDLMALVLQYVAYKSIQHDEYLSDAAYLHRYVISPMCFDMINIFHLNQWPELDIIFDKKTIKREINTYDMMSDKTYGYISSQLVQAMEDVYDLQELVRSNSIRPDVYIKSLMINKDFSLDNLRRMHNQTLSPRMNIQYMWATQLKEFKVFAMCVDSAMLNSNSIYCQNAYVKTKRFLDKLLMRKYWNSCKDSYMRSLVKEQIIDYRNMLDDKI